MYDQDRLIRLNMYQFVYGLFCLLYPGHLCRRVYSIRLSVHPLVYWFVLSLLSITLVEFTQSFWLKFLLSEDISPTTQQKAFIFEPWVF